jgi:hypothetical protein
MEMWETSIPWFYKGLQLGDEMAGCNLNVALQKLSRHAEAVGPSETCIRMGLRLLGELGSLYWVSLISLCTSGIIPKAADSPVHAPLIDNQWTRETAAANMINHGILMRDLRRIDDAVLAFERATLLNPSRPLTKTIAALKGQAVPDAQAQTFESSLEDMLGG